MGERAVLLLWLCVWYKADTVAVLRMAVPRCAGAWHTRRLE
jgi:hypothetical protein